MALPIPRLIQTTQTLADYDLEALEDLLAHRSFLPQLLKTIRDV